MFLGCRLACLFVKAVGTAACKLCKQQRHGTLAIYAIRSVEKCD